MSVAQVANRYAEAFYQTAKDKTDLSQHDQDMKTLASIFSQLPEVKHFCLAHHDSRQNERVFIETAFLPFLSGAGKRLLFLIVANERLACLPYLPGAFARIMEAQAGTVELLLETFGEPDESLTEAVRAKMMKRFGSTLNITKRRVPELGGGFRILCRNTLIDHSLKTKVRNLKRSLKSE